MQHKFNAGQKLNLLHMFEEAPDNSENIYSAYKDEIAPSLSEIQNSCVVRVRNANREIFGGALVPCTSPNIMPVFMCVEQPLDITLEECLKNTSTVDPLVQPQLEPPLEGENFAIFFPRQHTFRPRPAVGICRNGEPWGAQLSQEIWSNIAMFLCFACTKNTCGFCRKNHGRGIEIPFQVRQFSGRNHFENL